MAERIIVQRAITKEVLSYDLPGVVPGAKTTELSAVGSLELTVSPTAIMQLAADGLPVFQEWNTIVTVDRDGEIRFRGLVVDMQWYAPGWKITLASTATYLFGTPYEGAAYYGAKVDPATIVRKLVAHVQSYTQPPSDLGLTVSGTTPVRIGTYSTQNKADTLAAYNAAVKVYNSENAKLKPLRADVKSARDDYSALVKRSEAANAELSAAKKAKPKDQARINRAQAAVNQVKADKAAQQNVIDLRVAAVDAQAKVVAARKATKDAAYKKKVAAAKAAKDDGGAYELLPWEAPDCGDLLRDLAKSTPFDWFERSHWDSNGLPQTEIVIAYPRTGRRLSGDGDPTFMQGMNITVPLQPQTSGDDFANTVYGVGAGEGAGAIRRSVSIPNGRLRRVTALSSKEVKTATRMDARLRAELNSRKETLRVPSITVADHVNSPRGSYSLGDDIFVQGDVQHLGRFGLWHRIVGITENTDGSTELNLERSDSFTYGSGVPE